MCGVSVYWDIGSWRGRIWFCLLSCLLVVGVANWMFTTYLMCEFKVYCDFLYEPSLACGAL